MLANLVDLVLPRSCLGCGAGGAGVCAQCLDVRPVVRYVPGLGAVHGAASYGGAVRAAIIHYKDRRRRDLRAVLAALLGSAVAAARASAAHDSGPVRPLLVPIPSTQRAARDRGGDHMRRLAISAGRAERVRSAPILRVNRPIEDAARLGAQARRDNIAGAYVCRTSARAGPVILVDDVITTGASLLEAARTLRTAGYRVEGVAVIAIVPLAARINSPAARARSPGGPLR